MGKLTGKVAVVTGASKGIGAGIAKAFGREGASVVVNYATDQAGAERVAKEIESTGGKAVVVGGSVARIEEIDALFTEVKKHFGNIDVLVNNAGVFGPTPLEALTEAEYDRQFNTNVKGLLFVTKAALPLFGEAGGSVINISSVVSTRAFPGMSVYSATKGAVDTITGVLSAELGSKKIRVNAINPGMIVTEGTNAAGFTGADSAFEKQVLATTPLGRLGQPDDVADVAVFLASDDARWVTGSTLEVAGGSR
ncbi:MAG: SDR family NAD(P)-dependent oxidoreductase [Janthinobacterium lividum]